MTFTKERKERRRQIFVSVLKQRKEFAQQLIDILKAKQLTEHELHSLNQLTHNYTRQRYTFCSLSKLAAMANKKITLVLEELE